MLEKFKMYAGLSSVNWFVTSDIVPSDERHTPDTCIELCMTALLHLYYEGYVSCSYPQWSAFCS